MCHQSNVQVLHLNGRIYLSARRICSVMSILTGPNSCFNSNLSMAAAAAGASVRWSSVCHCQSWPLQVPATFGVCRRPPWWLQLVSAAAVALFLSPWRLRSAHDDPAASAGDTRHRARRWCVGPAGRADVSGYLSRTSWSVMEPVGCRRRFWSLLKRRCDVVWRAAPRRVEPDAEILVA